MRSFTDEQGREWVATALEEDTPRHHGRWYLVFHPADDETPLLAMPEVRWQTRATARRTLATIATFELRRRLSSLERRAGVSAPSGLQGIPDIHRVVNAG